MKHFAGFCVSSAGRRAILNIVMAAAALMIFAATFRAGIDRGMDRLVSMEGYGRILNAIAAVMTQQRFHEGGYAVSECIVKELEARGFTANPEIVKRSGTTVPQNLRAQFLDKLLENIEHDLPKLQSHCALEIRGLGADDVGYVDFAEVAFSLFGLHIRAFYYLFFLIYGLTLLVAVLERRGDLLGQIVLLSTAGLVYVSCYYSTLLQPEPQAMGNMLNPRFMPVLALIPGVHLLLLMVGMAPLSWWRVAVALFQSGVIFFAIHIRASAIFWIPVLLLAGVVLFLLALSHRRGGAERRGSLVFQGLIGQWPAFIALITILASSKAVAWSLHPVYREGGWLPSHAVWHSVYYSLQFHPKFVEKYGAYHDNRSGDEMPYAAAFAYLKAHPDLDKPDLFIAGTRSLKYDAMERLVRLASFEFLRRDPWFVLDTFLVVKEKFIWNNIVDTTVTEWSRAGWKARCLLFLTIGLIGGIAATRPIEQQRLSRLATVVTIAGIGSLAIPILTVPYRETMTEGIMISQIACMLLFSLVLAHLIALYRSWHRSRTASASAEART